MAGKVITQVLYVSLREAYGAGDGQKAGEATEMTDFSHDIHEDRFMLLEVKATQIRKMLLGSLLLAKDAWKEALLGTPEGLRVLKAVEEAEDDFIGPPAADPIAKLDDVLGVINRRARALFVVLEFLARRRE
jgi:hypothetical protein